MKNSNSPELHLFIIWSNARNKEKEIISDISNNFLIIQTFSITWSPYLIEKNFSRFYDHKLPVNSEKERHAGSKEFKLVVVRDNCPKYDFRETSKGSVFVNTNMFDSKLRYRDLTGGGHKVHCTNDTAEFKHDIVMLLGLSEKDFLSKYEKNENNNIILNKNIIGTNGWESFDELFYVLNECEEYLILRNSNNISLDYYQNNSGDVDLLVKDINRFKYILGDLSFLYSKTNSSSHSKVSINNKVILFELYESGRNLFHNKFEDYLFKNKILKNNFYCLNEKLEFYTLLYHALLLNRNLSKKHQDRITIQAKRISEFKNIKIDKKNLLLILINFFKEIDCVFIQPNDHNVFFNNKLLYGSDLLKNNKNRYSKFRSNIEKVVKINIHKYSLTIILIPKLNNEIDFRVGFRVKFIETQFRLRLGERFKY